MIKSVDPGTMALDEARRLPIPGEALHYRENLLLLYAVGGDSKALQRKSLLESLHHLVSDDPDDSDAYDVSGGLQFSVLYFFDADQHGIPARLQRIKDELESVLELMPEEATPLENGQSVMLSGIRAGWYVFASNKGMGTLEDVMLPVMQQGNEAIFDRAEDFLTLKDCTRLQRLELREGSDGNLVEGRTGKKMKFDLKKSKICIAGQLQNSGKSNVVIIKDCDFLTLDKIRGSEVCSDITVFFRQFL